MSWIGGSPRSAVGVAMEEEGVVVEVACVFCHFFSVHTIDRYLCIHVLHTVKVNKHIGNMLSYVCGMN